MWFEINHILWSDFRPINERQLSRTILEDLNNINLWIKFYQKLCHYFIYLTVMLINNKAYYKKINFVITLYEGIYSTNEIKTYIISAYI